MIVYVAPSFSKDEHVARGRLAFFRNYTRV